MATVLTTNKLFDKAGLEALLAKINSMRKSIMGTLNEGETRDYASLIALERAIEEMRGNLSGVTMKKLDTAEGDNAASYQLQDKDGAAIGDTINIAKDQHLKSAVLGTKPAKGNVGDVDYEPAQDALVLTWYVTVDGTTDDVVTYIPVGDFLREAEAGKGIEISSDKKYQVKIDADSEDFLTVGAAGVKLAGVQDAIDTAAAASKTSLTTVAADTDIPDTGAPKIVVVKSTVDTHDNYAVSGQDLASAKVQAAHAGRLDNIEATLAAANILTTAEVEALWDTAMVD